MRSIVKPVIVLALLATLASAPTVASAQGVAVVDVAKIFKTHAAIKAQVTAVENNLKQFDEQLKLERADLEQEVKKLQSFTAGTPNYTAQEEVIAGKESQLRLKMNRKRKELADAEAKIYFDNYQLIAKAVADVAQHNKISLVLRYNSEGMDLAQGESVVRGVMKNVVYHDSSLDLTPMIMQLLDSRIAAANAPAERR